MKYFSEKAIEDLIRKIAPSAVSGVSSLGGLQGAIGLGTGLSHDTNSILIDPAFVTKINHGEEAYNNGYLFQVSSGLNTLVELRPAYSYLNVRNGLMFSGWNTSTGIVNDTVLPDIEIVEIPDSINGGFKRVLHSRLAFYSDDFISAGGLSHDEGSAGIDLDAMWYSLTHHSDSHGHDKIDIEHIPDLSSIYQPVISDLSAIRSNAAEGHTVYGYFSGGILGFGHLPPMYVAGTQVKQTKAKDALLGVTVISNALESPANEISRIEWDSEHSAWHFIGGIYSDSFISAGGLSSGGGQSAGNASLSALASSASTMSSATVSANGVGSINIYSKEYIDTLIAAGGRVQTVAGVSPNTDGDVPVASLQTAIGLSDYLLSSTAESTYETIENVLAKETVLADAIGNIETRFIGINEETTALSLLIGETYSSLDERIAVFEDMFEIDEYGVHVKNNRGFYGDSWISAGGVSSGGGASGIDLDAMWSSLVNNTDSHANDKINSAHLPDLSGTYQPKYAFTLVGTANTPYNLDTINSRADEGHTVYGYFSNGVLDFSHLPTMYIARTQVKSSPGNDTLLGITAISNASSTGTSDKSRMVWDSTHDAWHFQGNVYADGWISAGGVSDGGGQSAGNASLSGITTAGSGHYGTISASGVGSLVVYDKDYIDAALQTAGTIQTLSLAAGASNGTIHLVINGTAQSDVSVTGLGAAAYRGVASSIGSSVTGLVDGALLYGILGDSFDSTNTVKDFVNSSIATATATYKGSFNLVSDLSLTTSATQAQIAAALGTAISTADNNDYCYVQIPTSDSTPTQIARVDRYKHNGTSWSYEYTLNNSGYTAAQWAAINSGITSALVTDFGNRFTTLEGYFTDGSAKSALKLTTTSKTIWGVTYWTSGGVPDNVTGRPNLYIGTTQVQTSSATQDLTGIGSISATGALTLTTTKKIYFGDTSHYLELDSNGFHFSHGVYSEGFMSAGGLSTGGGTTGIDLAAMWSSLTNATSDAYANTKIATAHIPDLSATYQTVIADLSTIRSRSDEGHTAYGWGNHADAGYITGNQTITLSGDVSGSGTTSISVTIGAGKVTNDMLAGSIANAKLANSAITINGSSTSLGGSFSTASITAGTAGTSSATSGYTLSVPYVTVNQYGIVTGYGTHTHTVNNIPNSSLANSSITIGTTSISLGGTSTTLAGLTSVTSQKFYLDADNYFEVVDGKVHLQVGTGGGFYTDGFISAGGLSTGSGDSGITESAMWTLLDNTDSTHKINAAHLRIGTGLAVDGNGNIYATNTAQGTITSVTKGSAVAGGDVTTDSSGAVTIQFPTDYSLPTASASTLGGVKVGNYLSISSGVLSVNEEKVTPITDEIGAIKTAIGGVARAEDILSLEGQIGGIWGELGYVYDNYLTTAAAADLYQTKYAFTITGQTGWEYALDTIAANAANGASAYSSLGNYVAKSGDTMTGSLTVNGGISTTTLSASSTGAFGGDVSISNGCSLWCKNSNNSIRIFADGGGDNYIESGNNAFTANADLHLTGYNGAMGGDLFLYFSWTEIYGSASIGGNITAWQNIICHGQVSAGVASDSRLKDNIETMTTEQALAIVSALRPVTFEWNNVATSHLDTLTGADFGLVAQEVESVIPQAVSPIWEKYKRVDYTKAVTPLIKVAQDHESRIASLERENRKLRAEVEHLRGRVCSGNS